MSLVRLAIAFFAAALVVGHPSVAEAQRLEPLSVCVIHNGTLTTVSAMRDRETGDTLVGNRRFSSIYQRHSGYAVNHPWFRESSTIAFGDEVYEKIGLPRIYGVSELSRIGAVSGVGVYRDVAERTPTRIFIPKTQGCEFQPYTPATGDALVDFAAAAYGKGDYATALRLLTRPALATDGRALAMLGELHHFGYGVTRDTAAARRLYDRAIANKGAEGYTGLGLLAALTGQWPRAAAAYRSGVSRGSARSAAKLAGLYVTGKRVGVDAAEAALLLRTAITRARPGDRWTKDAEADLARLYEAGQGVEGDAAAWFTSDSIAARQRGDLYAPFRMGRRYEMGWATWPDRSQAEAYYRNGARADRTITTKALERLTREPQ